ncbi:MAG: radical SAM protein [Methanomethylophilus sp.]|nr:radical SAM protein [Methanomethylophilus sp.]MDD4221694.1 radical SAM protein [Methanomethylophilus sp.]MDD4668266.1 radical SAM protein [Methanomethylophilus sp.]
MKVVEYFASLQGEGITIGLQTYFVRTAGCNLHCSWCDTKYAQRPEDGREMSVDQVMDIIGDAHSVCVTGGEPLEQPDTPELLRRLVAAGKTVVLETNGSKDLSAVPDSNRIVISMDIKCPSSGMQDRMYLPNLEVLTRKDQLKFIIADHIDLNYAERFLREHPVHTNVIFSPVGGVDLKMLAEEVVSRRLDVRVLPQLHKIIWGEKKGC